MRTESNAPLDQYRTACLEEIAAHGHMIQVKGESGIPLLCYTVGLSSTRGYELAISGLPSQVGGQILNSAAEELAARELIPAPGLELVGVIRGFAAILRQAHADDRFGVISLVLGRRRPVWQLVWPDAEHRFPGEAGCAISEDGQADLSIPDGGYCTIPAPRSWALPVRLAAGR